MMIEPKKQLHIIIIILARRDHPKQNSQIKPSQQREVLCSPRRSTSSAGSAGPTTLKIKRVIADIRVDTDSCARS